MCDLVDANKIVHKSLTSGAGGGWTELENWIIMNIKLNLCLFPHASRLSVHIISDLYLEGQYPQIGGWLKQRQGSLKQIKSTRILQFKIDFYSSKTHNSHK